VGLSDEMRQHLLGDLEVGDHPVFHGADGDDTARRSTEHFLGVMSHRFHSARAHVDGHDRWLGNDRAFGFDEHKRVRRPKVNREIVREIAEVKDGSEQTQGK